MVDNGKHIEELAMLVASGHTIRSAAAQMPFSESTAYRTSRESAFKQRVSELRTEACTAAVGKLTEAATKAVDTLVEMLDSDFDATVRLNAAKAILANLGPLTETAELRQRVDAIESQTHLKAA